MQKQQFTRKVKIIAVDVECANIDTKEFEVVTVNVCTERTFDETNYKELEKRVMEVIEPQYKVIRVLNAEAARVIMGISINDFYKHAYIMNARGENIGGNK